jgi:hypothetical protein
MASRAGARLIVGVVAAALCAEMLGVAAYYVDTGALFYVHDKAYSDVLPVPADRIAVTEAVHPYFGFTHAPGTPFDIPEPLRATGAPAVERRTNNFGFVSPVDYPVAKTGAGQILVGIFGGSVGLWFCQLGAPLLVEQLRQQFQGRDVVPLCFSHEGYKQPQQALVLAYFLSIGQQFDIVINIDGFNDVALARVNATRGIDISMPSAQHLDPLVNLVAQSTLTPEKLQSLASIVRDRARLADLRARIAGNRSAAVHFVLDRYHRSMTDQYVRELGRFATLPSNPAENTLIQVAPAEGPRAGAGYDSMAAVWASSSLVMHDLVASRGGRYFHFLQPNQYHTVRRFSAAEAAVALNDASPYRESVVQGYPVLQARAAGTFPGKLRFFDATGAFDREPEAVYVDDCCHYTLAGNRELARFIAQAVRGEPTPPD